MSTLQNFLRGLASVADRLDEASARGETDPLRIVDAMLGGNYSRNESGGQWWELFGLEDKPDNKRQLEGAWRRWAARNHPDAGGSEATFRHMRTLFERMRDTLPD
jgi:hypothetical protein